MIGSNVPKKHHRQTRLLDLTARESSSPRSTCANPIDCIGYIETSQTSETSHLKRALTEVIRVNFGMRTILTNWYILEKPSIHARSHRLYMCYCPVGPNNGGSSGLGTMLYHRIFFWDLPRKVQEFVQGTKYTSTSIIPADGIKMIAQKLSWLAWGS